MVPLLEVSGPNILKIWEVEKEWKIIPDIWEQEQKVCITGMVWNRKTENWNISFVNFADTSLFPHLKTDLSAGEPLGTVSPSYEKHLKIRVFRKSPTFEFCSALLRSGVGTQSHMEGPGNHFQGYRPINDTQQADFKVIWSFPIKCIVV